MMRSEFFFISCLAAALAGCAAGGQRSKPEPLHTASTYEKAGRLGQVMEFLNRNYVDESKAGYDRLLEAALRGMMRELDPYSGYEPPAEFTVNEEARTGEQSGIGIDAVKVENAPVLITAVLPGGPADKAGILPGRSRIRAHGIKIECPRRLRLPGPVRDLRIGEKFDIQIFIVGNLDGIFQPEHDVVAHGNALCPVNIFARIKPAHGRVGSV